MIEWEVKNKKHTYITENLKWTPESSEPRYTYFVCTHNTSGKYLTGLTTGSNDNENFKELSKYEHTYDEVVPDFITSATYYTMTDGVWTKDYGSSKNDVTRDEKGRVTEVMKYRVNQKGEYITREKDFISYGEDGKPSQIKVYE